ncbi:MAG: isocitrate lyase/phosphoenolpyruvate mutase family protein [Rudaea sp.]
MPNSQHTKAKRFRALHENSKALLIPNPWDAGSARVLAALGYQALATSSGAAAGVLGRRDGEISRDEALTHAREIVTATDLPVSADLEHGFGDAPDTVAETIRLAAVAGLVGGSIEDSTGNPAQPQYPFDIAVARVAAAIAAARALDFPFTLTARAENFVCGNPDLDDTIQRLQAYERAGADVLFAIGLPDLAAVRAVCAAVKKPVNFMAGMPGKSFSVAELEAAGVRRISLGTSLYKCAMSNLVAAAREVADMGSFGYLDRTLAGTALNQLLHEGANTSTASE